MQDNTQAKPTLAVGQVWKDGEGDTVEITHYTEDEQFPWVGSYGLTYTDDGHYLRGMPGHQLDGSRSLFDLVELVRDAPTQATKPVVNHIYFYSATLYKNGNQTNVSGLYISHGVKIQSEADYAEFLQNIAHSLMVDKQDLHVSNLSYLGESE